MHRIFTLRHIFMADRKTFMHRAPRRQIAPGPAAMH
jgi:hypothetical protein